MTTPSEIFTQSMRDRRKMAGLTQAELAELVSEQFGRAMDVTTVTRIETGGRMLRLDDAVAIAGALQVPLATLLTEPDEIEVEITRLRQNLAEAYWSITQAEEEIQRQKVGSNAIKQRIAELEAARQD